MPRKAKDIIPRELEPRLFDFPEEPHLLEVVKRYRHTGTTAMKDEPRLAMAVELMLAGVGLERVAERVRGEFGIGFGVYTLRAIRDELAAGNLAGYKQRITSKVKMLSERVADSIADDLDTGALEPGQKPVLLGILLDKAAQLDGVPGLVVEHRHQVVLNVDRVNELLAGKLAPESVSGEPQAVSEPIDVESSVGPWAGPSPAVVPTGAGPSEGGGGGRVSPPVGREADVSASGELPAKESSHE